MTEKLIEVTIVVVVISAILVFSNISGIVDLPAYKSAIKTYQLTARQGLLMVQNFESLSYPNRTILDLIYLGYLTNSSKFFTNATSDLSYYLPIVMDKEYYVYTTDGKINISSPGFYNCT